MFRLIVWVPICLLFTLASKPFILSTASHPEDEEFQVAALERYSSHGFFLGKHCERFEDQAQELCSFTGKDNSAKLAILMANCNLEKLSAEPLPYSDIDGMKNASEAEKVIAMQMVTRLPIFCTSLKTLGIRLGLVTSKHFANLNETIQQLHRLSKLSTQHGKDRNLSLRMQQKVLAMNEEALRQSISLSHLFTDIQKSTRNFSEGLDRLFDQYEKFEKERKNRNRETQNLVSSSVREARLLWERTEDYARHRIVLSKVEHQLGILQTVLVFGIVYVILNQRPRPFTIGAVVILVVCTLVTLYLFTNPDLVMEILEVDMVKRIAATFAKSAIYNVHAVAEYIRIEGVIDGHYVIVAFCVLLVFVSGFVFPKLGRMAYSSSAQSRPRMRGFDIHNVEEVIAFLRHQENNIQQVESDVAMIAQELKTAISEGMAHNNAVFSRFSDHTDYHRRTGVEDLERKVGSSVHSNDAQKNASAITRGSSTRKHFFALTTKATHKKAPTETSKSKSKVKPYVVNHADDDTSYETEVTPLGSASSSEDSFNSKQYSTDITPELDQASRDGETGSGSESNDTSITTVITEWDGIPLYSPSKAHGSNIEMEDEEDGMTTDVTPCTVSPGGTSGTWSQDSDEVRREKGKLSMIDSTDSSSVPGVSGEVKSETASNRRMAINILKKRATDSKAVQVERRNGKVVQKSTERRGENKLRHETSMPTAPEQSISYYLDGKAQQSSRGTNRRSRLHERNTGKASKGSPKATGGSSSPANEAPKSSSPQSSRRLSRTRSGPRGRSAESPSSPSHYNLRRTSRSLSSPSNYNLRRRPTS